MDLRYAWRSLLRTPGFSLLIVATLALGIGATTTMFSAVWAVFLRPLPFPDQQRLVTIWQADPQTPRRGNASRRRISLTGKRRPLRSTAIGALPNWTGEPWIFNVASGAGIRARARHLCLVRRVPGMGVEPLLGRALSREDDRTRGMRIDRDQLRVLAGSIRRRYRPLSAERSTSIRSAADRSRLSASCRRPSTSRAASASGCRSRDWGGGPMPPPDASQRCCSVVHGASPG